MPTLLNILFDEVDRGLGHEKRNFCRYDLPRILFNNLTKAREI